MLEIITCFTAVSFILVVIRLFKSHNHYEKILSCHVAFCHLLILVLTNAAVSLSSVLDIALILFLLQMAAILLLLKFKNNFKNNNETE